MAVEVKALSGDDLQAALPDLARLRIAVFRAFPYLYEGSEAYEQDYMRSLSRQSAVRSLWRSCQRGASWARPQACRSGITGMRPSSMAMDWI